MSSKDNKSQPKDSLPLKPSSEKSSRARRPQPLIKLVMRRLPMFPFLLHFLLLSSIFPVFLPPLFCSLHIALSFRLESSFRSFSRPVLHAASRVVQEMGKSRAAAYSLGVGMDEGTQLYAYSENVDSVDPYLNDSSQSEGNLGKLILLQ